MAVAVGNDIAKLDERVAPPDRLKTQAAQILEPCLVEQMLRRLVLLAPLTSLNERDITNPTRCCMQPERCESVMASRYMS